MLIQKYIFFVWVEKPDFRGTGGKVGSKLKKNCHFFQGNQEQLFHFSYERIEEPLSHILDPNYRTFYLKCPRKCQKNYNFDMFPTLSQICTSLLLNFGVNP